MRRLLSVALLLALGGTAAANDNPKPTVFAPGVISSVGDEGSAAFMPDGSAVYFSRSVGEHYAIMVSHRQGNGWSAPQNAPFSGHWLDTDVAMSPDGSFLVFGSNRPADGKGAPMDGVVEGKRDAG